MPIYHKLGRIPLIALDTKKAYALFVLC